MPAITQKIKRSTLRSNRQLIRISTATRPIALADVRIRQDTISPFSSFPKHLCWNLGSKLHPIRRNRGHLVQNAPFQRKSLTDDLWMRG